MTELSSEVSNVRRHNSSLETDNKRFEEQLLRHKNATMDSQDKHTHALQVNILFVVVVVVYLCLRSCKGRVGKHRNKHINSNPQKIFSPLKRTS